VEEEEKLYINKKNCRRRTKVDRAGGREVKAGGGEVREA
jgi:hypothetical protein